MKVPVSVINGKSPMNTSCSLMSIFSGSLFTKRTFTRSGAA
jgi:hypothetical protein